MTETENPKERMREILRARLFSTDSSHYLPESVRKIVDYIPPGESRMFMPEVPRVHSRRKEQEPNP